MGWPYFPNHAFELVSCKLEVSGAPEPSNVRWESLQVSRGEMKLRKLKVSLLIICFFVLLFYVQIWLRQEFSIYVHRFPPTLDCNRVNLKESNEITRQFAEIDKKSTLLDEGIGVYQCFCKSFSTIYDALDRTELCYQYQFDTKIGQLFSWAIAVFISLTNFLIEKLFQYFVKQIGYKSQSEESRALMTYVFFIQFTNTAVILMVAHANYKFSMLSFIPIQNQYADFTSDWYLLVGDSLVKTQLINAFQP